MIDDWHERTAAMTDQLIAAGYLSDPRMRAAFTATPRHLFVPRFFHNHPQRGWVAVAAGDEDYPEAVYQPELLVTQLDGDPTSWDRARRDGVYHGGWPSSSSSSPTLMALMLEALNLDDQHHVLEVGTGTGYNAAILCHRLRDAHVTSIDIDPALITQARTRLAHLGHHPRLHATDAMTGLPDGRYDRIEVTVAVPHIPPWWVTHLNPGGSILVNLTSGLLSDAMFNLHASADGTATGPAINHPVFFMPTRSAHLPPAYRLHANLDTSNRQRIHPEVDFAVINDHDSGFPTFLALRHRDLQRFLTDNAPTWNWIIATDGSWVHHLDHNTLEQGGPRQLWPHIEQLHHWWNAQHRPTRTRLGLTIHPDGTHQPWLDDPDQPFPWQLTPHRS